MNILITTQHGEVAGATYSIFYLARGLQEQGDKVVLGIRFGTLLHELAAEVGIDCVNISFKNKLHWASMHNINQIVRSRDIDLIYAQESKDRYLTIFARIIYRFKAKLVLARRQRIADSNFFKRWLYIHGADKTVVISDGLRKMMRSKKYPEKHLETIYNGLPIDEYVLEKELVDQLTSRYQLKETQKIIGCVARPKLQNELFEAMRSLPSNYRLLLVGITESQFRDFFPSCDPSALGDRLIFAGIIRDKRVLIHHYSLMDVHVLPSSMDGFGLVSVEAMAMGIPAIGSNYGGIPDVIQHGQSGFIYELGEVQQLTQYIRDLIEDKDLRERFIRAGCDRALNVFSISKTVRNYHDFFQKLISS